MADTEKKQINTRSYRVDDETAEKIASLAKELGLNQNGVFEVLLSAYELQQDAYQINAQTEERVRQEFQWRLDNNDKQIADLLETKEQQKARIDELQDSYKKAEGDLMLRESELAETKQRVLEKEKSLEDKNAIIDSLNARLPEQAEIEAKMKSLDKEIQELRSSLSSSERMVATLTAAAAKDKSELYLAKKQAEATEKAHKKEIETLKKQAAADLKAAVSDARQEERDKAQAKADKLQEKIDELRAKVDEQRDIIAGLSTAK